MYKTTINFLFIIFIFKDS